MSTFVAIAFRTMSNARRIVPDEGFRPRVSKARPRHEEPAPQLVGPPIRVPIGELDRVVDLVARMHGTSFAELVSCDRCQRVAHARQAAICAIRQSRPHWSLSRIGHRFGLDHTTVLHALRRRGVR